VNYAGLAPGFAVLCQINVTIPAGVGSGIVNLNVLFPDGTLSNNVQIVVQ
jgi:uncharacterized protein (TIGR03437 family)